MRTLFWTVAVTALLMEAMEVALPNAKYISGIKAKTAEWGTNALLLPADLLEQMQGLLTYLQVSIFASLLVQLVVMALAVVIALFSYSAVIAGVEGLLRRFTPLPQRMPDGLSAADLNSFYLRDVDQFRVSLAAGCAIAAVLSLVHEISVKRAALTFIVVLVLFELARLHRLRQFVKKLPSQDARKSAFTWFHQSARDRVVALVLNILLFAYVLFPVFFSIGRAAQEAFVLPLFATIASRFNELLLDGVRTYGNIFLEGDMAVSFERMKQAYTANTGAGAISLDILLPLLPFLFFAWTIVLMTRLFVPMVLELGGAKSAFQVLKVSIIASVSGTAFQQAAVRIFHVDTTSALNWALVVAFALTFTLYLRQAMTMAPASIKCSNGHLNSKSAKFCNECGVKL